MGSLSVILIAGWIFLIIHGSVELSSDPIEDTCLKETGYKCVFNSSLNDNLFEGVLYQIVDKQGRMLFLNMTPPLEDGDEVRQLQLGYPAIFNGFKAFENVTTSFAFLPFGDLSLAAVSSNPNSKNYVRFLFMDTLEIVEEPEIPGIPPIITKYDILASAERTTFRDPNIFLSKPFAVCEFKNVHFVCDRKRFSYAVYPVLDAGTKCQKPQRYHLFFEKESTPTWDYVLSEYPEVPKIYPSVSSLGLFPRGSDNTFHFAPIVSNVKAVVIDFKFLQSPTDIVQNAQMVNLGVSETIINKGDVEFIQQFVTRQTTQKEETWSFSWSLKVGIGFSMSSETKSAVGGGGSTKLAGKIEASGGQSSVMINTTTESLEMTQSVLVKAGKRVKCSSFYKVVPHTALKFKLQARISIFWKFFNTTLNSVVSKLMPLDLVRDELPTVMKGWDIVTDDGKEIIAEMQGEMVAEHGIASVFYSEDIE